MREVDEMAVLAAKNEEVLSEFVNQHQKFIIMCIYRTINRYITKSDDEWSVALIAFCDAVKNYQLDKGSFFAFAEMLIRNRLIDHFRREQKYVREVVTDPIHFDGNRKEYEQGEPIRFEEGNRLREKTMYVRDTSIAEEIQAANQVFQRFGFSFMDLSKCSPKSKKTKEYCKVAVQYILSESFLIQQIIDNGTLPIKIIQKNTNLPQKFLDRFRKYIIAAVIILSGEYPKLSEYLLFIRRGGV